ncbi:H-NS family nucleoid-associated regulatory protein [Burkholderia cepacia]|uniref:H-NS family nucleoid-associated regulatory protein n=1 Tax=Burkholderia cepacia TaxID=292 RepID=UPI0015899D4B|nr:H-NS family nucleoid-associated regulatory protein [Burkholderia cepacia]
MPTYLELLARKRALDAEIEKARAEAAVEALAAMRATIAEFGFTPEDLFGKAKRKGAGRDRASSSGRAKAVDVDRATLDLFAAPDAESAA